MVLKTKNLIAKIIVITCSFFFLYLVKKLQVITYKIEKKKLQVLSDHLQLFYPTGAVVCLGFLL